MPVLVADHRHWMHRIKYVNCILERMMLWFCLYSTSVLQLAINGNIELNAREEQMNTALY